MNITLGQSTKIPNTVTIDIFGEPDIKFDLNHPLTKGFLAQNGFTGEIERIEAYHLFEHLRPETIFEVAKSWVELLKPGGTLVIELPDFDRVLGWYLMTQDDEALTWIFGEGSREGQHHYWGWNKERLYHFFKDLPVKAYFAEPKDSHSKIGPCLRMELVKK